MHISQHANLVGNEKIRYKPIIKGDVNYGNLPETLTTVKPSGNGNETERNIDMISMTGI